MTICQPGTRIRPTLQVMLIVLLAGLSWSRPVAGSEALTVVSWGGSYARACQKIGRAHV